MSAWSSCFLQCHDESDHFGSACLGDTAALAIVIARKPFTLLFWSDLRETRRERDLGGSFGDLLHRPPTQQSSAAQAFLRRRRQQVSCWNYFCDRISALLLPSLLTLSRRLLSLGSFCGEASSSSAAARFTALGVLSPQLPSPGHCRALAPILGLAPTPRIANTRAVGTGSERLYRIRRPRRAT